MGKTLKKGLSVFLVILILLTSAPLRKLTGVNIANIFSSTVSAAGGKVDDSDYSYMAQIILNYNYDGAALIGDTTLPNMRLKRFMDPTICSVSRPTVDELNSNGAFVTSASLWKVATFDLSAMLNAFEEEVGYYQAIILNILNSAIEYSIVPSTVTSYTKNITAIQKNIDKYRIEGLNTALGVNLWNSQLTPDEALELYNNLEAERVKVNKRITNATDVSSLINSTMTVIDVIEKFAAHAAIADLSENIKAVIDELYSNCPVSNAALKAALLEVKTVMKSTLDRIGVDLTNAVWQAGKVAIEAALSELWVGALESVVGNLAAGILIGQVIGKAVCNMMFSTDSIIEQWYKLNALVEFEDIMYTTINSLSNKFRSSPNEENALVLLSAIEILGNMYIEDYNMSEDLVKYVYEKGLWNNIKKGFLKIFNKYDDSEVAQYHDDINYLKGAVNDLYEITKPEFYTAWMIIDKGMETGADSEESNMAKVVSVKCPTDVEIYDSSNNLIVSIVNDEIEHLALGTYVNIVNSEKTVYLTDDEEYSVKVIATDNGTMDYSIVEIENGLDVRSVVYEDVILTDGSSYSSSLTLEKYENAENYDLKSEDGTTVEASFDSLPPVDDSIIDVIIAEELFDGFPIEIIDLVANTMFSMGAVVDLSAYDISTDDAVALFSAVAKYYPAEYSLISNSDFTYKIIVSPNLDRIMKIRFYYGDDANLSAYQKRVKDLNAEINALVERVAGMNEFEKALYIHDYIVLNSEYDLELLDYMEKNSFILPGELRSEKYTEYSILVNGTGVCGSYALAYRAVLNAAGMECLYLSSSQMNHAWNLVKIDGKWYHVDCCWDDPTPDTYGRARRTYFLRTDDEIMNLNHYSWTPGRYKANSEKYSDMPRNYDIKQKYDDGKWYYLTGSTLYSSDEYGKNETEITSISASSIDADNGNVYYSNGRYIYEYDIENDERNLVYMLSNSDSGDKPSEAYLSNIYVDNENVDYYKSIYMDNKRITNYDTDLLQREKFASITGIEISKNEIELDVFDTAQLSAKILSSSSTYELSVKWSSSNDNVVSVDDQGVIIARNKGNAIITCSFDTYIATCKITINRDKLTGFCGDNAIWELDNNGLLKISGSGGINDYKNSTSSIPWNKYKSQVLRVEIVEDINKIGSYAFYRCDRLESIDIKSKVTSIGDYAFAYCDSLKNIKLNDGLMIIGSEVFCRSGMKTITIPATTISINEFAFSDCNWESIYVDENNSVFSSDKFGVLYNKDKTTLIKYPADNEKTSYDLPSSVKTIKKFAFADTKKLQNIIIPDSVNMIEMYAFENCKELEKISIGSGITKIENSTFLNCKKLREVSLPNTLTSIGTQAFAECYEIVKITIPDGVKIIEDYSFANCISLRCVKIGKNTSSIGYEVFLNCKALESIIIPQNVKNIGGYVFGTTTRVDFDENGNVIFQETVGCERLKKIYFDNQAIVFGGDLGSEATIYGFSQSTAEDYANRYKYDFIAADATPHNHDYFLMDYVEPNKEQDGYEYYECYCGESNYTTAIHYFDDIKTIEPTCVTDGSKVHACINCGNVDILETIPATGKHSYELVSTTPGTCTVAPVNTYECSTCGDTYTKTGKIEDGHSYEKTVVAPTCEEKGYTQEVCRVCDETLLSDFTSPKGHEFVINKSADYCSAHGTLEYSCKNCDYTESVVSDEADLVTETVTVEPTCTKSGTKAEICTLCGATVSVDILNPLSHEYSEEYTVDMAATCTTTGRKSQHCIRCDAKRAVTTIEATGHQNTGIINAADATCTNNGYTGDTYCSDCKTVIATGESLSKLSHHYVTVVTEPTCTSKGFTTHTCTACGDSYTDTETAMISHSYSSVVTPVTCTLNGYTTHTCIVCSHSYTSDTVMLTGHNYNDNGICVGCGKNRTENCSHMCHKSGFMGVIWKIVRFFWKLFKMNPVCECGIAHY